jgi:hypothetical protein
VSIKNQSPKNEYENVSSLTQCVFLKQIECLKEICPLRLWVSSNNSVGGSCCVDVISMAVQKHAPGVINALARMLNKQ